jgi:hypothetical protein
MPTEYKFWVNGFEVKETAGVVGLSGFTLNFNLNPSTTNSINKGALGAKFNLKAFCP